MVEINRWNRGRKAYQKRVNDAHIAQMRSLGMEDVAQKQNTDGDEMGDTFSIAGDTTTNITVKSPQEAAKILNGEVASGITPLKAFLLAAITAALGGAAVLGGLQLFGNDKQEPTTQVVDTDTDTARQYTFEVGGDPEWRWVEP